jgi:hypothetical protein
MVKTSWVVRGEYSSLSRHLTEHSAKQDKASESATFSNLFQQHLPQFRRLADQNRIQMEKCQMEKYIQLKTEPGSCRTFFVFKTQNLKPQVVYIENIHGEHIQYCMRQVLKSLQTLIDHSAKQETVNSDDKQVIHL